MKGADTFWKVYDANDEFLSTYLSYQVIPTAMPGVVSNRQMIVPPNKILFTPIILQKIKLSIDKMIFTCTFTPAKKK
jgi:hypothetical protein